MDLTAVRADLKAWEKSFKAENGREPSKADIKAVPDIAEKYRIYSKSRSDKAVPSTSAPDTFQASKKPAPSNAAQPVTPSKSRVANKQQGNADIFKTPGRREAAQNGSHQQQDQSNGQSATQFAFAPSPSRLRALAASRSFTGSPNRKQNGMSPQQDATEASEAAQAPRNLGRSLVLPPTIDTPRTKAKKWLAGDTVSPPVKLRLVQEKTATQSIPKASSSSRPIVSNVTDASASNKSSFWSQMDMARSSNKDRSEEVALKDMMAEETDANAANEMQEENDFLAPSPVKPVVMKGKGKSRLRLLEDLGSQAAIPDSSSVNTGAKPFMSSTDNTRRSKSPMPGIFSSDLPKAGIPTSSSDSRGYVPGISKPKKRIASMALVPNVSEDFEHDVVKQPMETTQATVKGKGKAALKHDEGNANSKDKKASRRGVKRQKQGNTAESKQASTSGAVLEEDIDDSMLLDDADLLNEVASKSADEEEEEEYEVRNLSDEYEGFKRKPNPMAALQQSQEAARLRESSAPILDGSIDPDLVSLLSLRASPVKNRLSRLQKKREETVGKILHEPTYVMAAKREVKGLEDLEEEHERFYGRKEETEDDLLDTEEDWHIRHDAEEGEEAAEASDDDWASEPEGWKYLDDGEMPSD